MAALKLAPPAERKVGDVTAMSAATALRGEDGGESRGDTGAA
jgi:hypothetical protein